MELGERLKSWLRQDWGVAPALPGEPQPATSGDDLHDAARVLLELPREDAARASALTDLDTRGAAFWIRFDQALREVTEAERRAGRLRRLPGRVLQGTADTLDLIVSGCHRDGRLREAAAILLDEHGRPATAAVLALRACEWAHQVRSAARDSLTPMLTGAGDDGPLLLVTVDLAVALSGRQHGGWLRDQVEGLLPGLSAEQLQPLLSAASDRVRRLAYAAGADRISLDQLLAAAGRDPDTVVRRTCAHAVLARAATDLPVLRRLRDSRNALVRAEAVRLMARLDEFDAESALTDPYPLVREVAQAAVRRAGHDPADHYRRLAVGSPLPVPILAGLGETGTPADAELLRSGLSHPSARGRLTALRALRRLGPVPDELLRPLLDDPSTAVLRLAARTVAEQPSTGWQPLRDLAGPGRPHAQRVAAFRALNGRDPWWTLETALDWLSDPDTQLRELAQVAVLRWPGGARLRHPAGEVLARVAASLDRAEPVIGRSQADLLRFIARVGDYSRR